MKISELKNIEPNPCDPKFYPRYFALIEVVEAVKEFARITAFIPETHDIRSNLLRAIAKLEGEG